MSDEWTVDELDEFRTRAVFAVLFPFDDPDVDFPSGCKAWQQVLCPVQASRAADEAAGLSTQALLDVLNGKAVIVPVEPTSKQRFAGYTTFSETKMFHDAYRAAVLETPYKVLKS